MDRRAFLLGTAAVVAPTALAHADMAPRIQLADLRGSLAAIDSTLRPGAIDDQSQAMQAAIDKAAAEGRPLFLPPGRYEVSNLSLPSRLRIIGIPGQTRLVYTGGGHFLHGAEGSGIGLDGIVLDGANRALAEDVPGLLHLISVADVTIERCEIVGSARNALALEGVSGRVSSNRLTGAREAALWSVNARGLSVTDNVVADCGDGGILIHRWDVGADDTIVSRNRVQRIDARSGGTGQVGNGINVYQAGGVVIADNHVSDCAFSAIRSNAGNNVQITGNQCLRSGETAIYSEFGFQGAVISSNLVDGAAIGVSVANFDVGGRLAVVSGNVIRNLKNGAPYPDEFGLDFGLGISIEADTTVTGNVIEGAPTLGILMGWGPFLRNLAVTGNMIRDCRIGMGVSVVEGAGDVYIGGNVVTAVKEGALRGMRWAEFVTGDLLGTASGAFPHLTVGDNRVG